MKENEITIFDFASPVYKVMQEENLFMGVGMNVALMIIMITTALVFTISIWCCLIGLILFLLTRFICRKDSFMLSFILSRMLENDVLEN